MAVHRRTSRARTLLVVLVLLSITLVTVDARSGSRGWPGRLRGYLHDGLSPIQQATHSALRPLGDFLAGAADHGALQAENERLRREVAALQAQGIAGTAATAEAQGVIAGAHLPFVGSIPTVATRVIDQGATNFSTTVTVDKGSADGLAVGQPVVAAGPGVAGGGLVGSVGAVASHTATVDLLTNPGSVVGVRLSNGNTGKAEGLGAGNPLQVSVISTGVAARPTDAAGATVVTSGLQLEAYPPGIPVGRITKVVSSPGSTEPSYTLSPLVDLDQLDLLEVELWSPQTATP